MPRRTGIGGHSRPNRGRSDDWITPPDVIAALGSFDLDPCASETQPWPSAARMIRLPQDGLAVGWDGRVWLNPPYGQATWTWLARLADHGRGTALIFARTEVEGFHRTVWERATALLFLRGRLFFHYPDGRRAAGNAGGPSVLVAYGHDDASVLEHCGLRGAFVRLAPRSEISPLPALAVIDGGRRAA